MIHCGAHGEHQPRYSICMWLWQLEREAQFPGVQLRDRMVTVATEKRGEHSCSPRELQSPSVKLHGFRSRSSLKILVLVDYITWHSTANNYSNMFWLLPLNVFH